MNQITHSPVQQAMEKLQALSNDDEASYRAWARERALLTEISELSAAEQRGIEAGEHKNARTVALRLLARHRHRTKWRTSAACRWLKSCGYSTDPSRFYVQS